MRNPSRYAEIPSEIAGATLDDLRPLIQLLGKRVTILNPRAYDTPEGGGDIDCATCEPDPRWALRLPSYARLCQVLHHDIGAHYWVIDIAGDVVAIDSLSDPHGLSSYGFSTNLLEGSSGPMLSAARASYLAAKRIRKKDRQESSWRTISSLAREDPGGTQKHLAGVFGRRLAEELLSDLLRDRIPSGRIWRRAARVLQVRRFRTPWRVLRITSLQASRLWGRLRRPTGLSIVVAGPDGSGKSTFAQEFLEASRGLFRRYDYYHWSPGPLPRPGSLIGKPQRDASSPHAAPPRGRTLSLGLSLYHWFNFVLGSWLRVMPWRLRSGLVIGERGWWDLAVDPRRYRLRVPGWWLRFLGRLIPKPDLVFVLDAPAQEMLTRKGELTGEELERQRISWRAIQLPSEVIHLDATRPVTEVVSQAREHLLRVLERRALGRLGGGWVSLPSRRVSRWVVPRSPRRLAKGALSIYMPVTWRARLGWGVLRLMSSVGLLSLLPRSAAPDSELLQTVSPHVPFGGSVALSRLSDPHRNLVLILDPEGRAQFIAKIASTSGASEPLEREAVAIREVAKILPEGVDPPQILSASRGVLILEAVQRVGRGRPWVLPKEVASALGAIRAQSNDDRSSLAHGDAAPWNLLRTSSGWVLIDWESARRDAVPFHDVFHYVVQSHALLGHPSRSQILKGLRGSGWIGEALHAYSRAAGIDPLEAKRWLVQYLHESLRTLNMSSARAARGELARQKLLRALRA